AFLEKESRTASDAVKNRWSIGADYMGNFFAAAGDAGGAAACYRKALEISPGNVVVMSHLAQALLASGDFDGAVKWLRDAIRLKPQNAILHFQLAQAYRQARRIEDAIRELREGLKFAPDDPNALGMLQYLRSQ